jgi:hypothetical protein
MTPNPTALPHAAHAPNPPCHLRDGPGKITTSAMSDTADSSRVVHVKNRRRMARDNAGRLRPEPDPVCYRRARGRSSPPGCRCSASPGTTHDVETQTPTATATTVQHRRTSDRPRPNREAAPLNALTLGQPAREDDHQAPGAASTGLSATTPSRQHFTNRPVEPARPRVTSGQQDQPPPGAPPPKRSVRLWSARNLGLVPGLVPVILGGPSNDLAARGCAWS